MNRLALLVKNRHQYEIDNLRFNLKLKGNTRVNFSDKYRVNYRNKDFISLNWHDEIKKYTNDKLLFSSLIPEDIHPKIYKLSEVEKEKRYFIKPKMGSGGVGIRVMGGDEILSSNLNDSIIQRYIEPELINGRKFDVRIYYFVIKHGDHFNSWYSKNGKLRLCEKRYDEGGELTNTTLLGDNIDRESLQGNLYNLLERDRDKIYNLIKNVNGYLRKSIIETGKDYITMYGLDLIQDIDHNWHIIEVNGNPNWQNSSDSDKIDEMKTNIFDEILKILCIRFYNKYYELEHWENIE